MSSGRNDEARRKYLREEYTSRINRVIDHIESNLDQDLSLETLARVAGFSRFHFHRIFRAMVGETLNQFIQRVRVEKAAMQLIANPKKSITEIAFDCGFSGSATFARAFREAFDLSASEWRSVRQIEESKNRKTDRKKDQMIGKIRKEKSVSILYDGNAHQSLKGRIEMKGSVEAKVEVREMPEMHVAYVRHIGAYAGQSALFEKMFGKLMKWAGPRGLIRFPQTQVVCVYHDDPNITEEEKLRTSACITVPEETTAEGEIGRMAIPGGQFAVARFTIDTDQFEDAWNMVCGDWLPESGFQPDDRLCYELCHNDPKEHPEGKHIIDICVPVRPL